jgi:hypothetical protein
MEGSLYPLDTIRTRMKVNSSASVALLSQVKAMYMHEGFRSYFKGFSCILMGSFMCNGFYFYTYEKLKSLFKTKQVLGESAAPFVAAFFGGFACDLLYLPFDVVRARMQLEAGAYDYKNVFDGLNKMLKKEGVTSLRRCGPVYFALSAVQTSLTFGFYEFFQKSLKPYFGNSQEVNLPLAVVSSVGAASISACLANPLDVLLTRKQTLSPNIGTMELVKNIIKTEGPKGFMKGVSGTICYYALSSAILFPTYEVLKTVFNIDLDN